MLPFFGWPLVVAVGVLVVVVVVVVAVALPPGLGRILVAVGAVVVVVVPFPGIGKAVGMGIDGVGSSGAVVRAVVSVAGSKKTCDCVPAASTSTTKMISMKNTLMVEREGKDTTTTGS